jgi:N-methylhydantoinase A/oxoprolinase/acetone carboxylase beta subunit
MLPLRLIQALQGHPDALVVCVLAASAGALCVENARAGIALLAFGLVFYHFRRTTAESHEREMAELRLEEQRINLKHLKSRYRGRFLQQEPEQSETATSWKRHIEGK